MVDTHRNYYLFIKRIPTNMLDRMIGVVQKSSRLYMEPFQRPKQSGMVGLP